VPLRPALPDALRVREIVSVARRLRGDALGPAVDSLASLGVEALAPRLARTLAAEEGRAVLLAEALGSARVGVLLVEEPRVRVDPRAVHRIGAAFREFARDGRTVIFVTSSARDAEALGDDIWQLRSGCLQGPCPLEMSPTLESLTGGASLHVIVSDSRALASSLLHEADIEGVTYDGGGLRVFGRSALALASAVGRAIVAAEVVVHELRFVPGDALTASRTRQENFEGAERPPAVTT
jgi:energy-coupling factor transporter ATP-binding protein EcfA2